MEATYILGLSILVKRVCQILPMRSLGKVAVAMLGWQGQIALPESYTKFVPHEFYALCTSIGAGVETRIFLHYLTKQNVSLFWCNFKDRSKLFLSVSLAKLPDTTDTVMRSTPG